MDPKRRFVVLVAEKLGATGLRMLSQNPDIELHDLSKASRPELLAAIPGAHALLVRSATKVDRELLTAGVSLRVVGRAGVGVDNVDVDAATERGILVVNAPSGNTLAAVEQTFAILLALLRKIPDAVASLRRGEWKRAQFVGSELAGKKLGVVGLGRIGSEVARRAQAFGCTILGYDPYLPTARAQELGFSLRSFEQILAESDILTLHMPSEAGAPPLLGAEQLAQMKPTAIVVNCARGALIDEAALTAALRDGKLGGAALDVFAEEPPKPDHPLFALPNVVATPHLGASTEEAQERVAVQTVETVLAVLGGSFAVSAVNLPFAGTDGDIGPLLDLAKGLGGLAAGVVGGNVAEVAVDIAALPEKSLPAAVAAALSGALSIALGDDINIVSAPKMAAERGVRILEGSRSEERDYGNRITVRVSGDKGSASAAGTLFSDRHGRVVAIDAFRIELEPRGYILYIVNRNVPGVVGKVGTLLGESGVNIADMALAKHPSGERALACITIDAPPDPAVLERLSRIPEIESVRLLRL